MGFTDDLADSALDIIEEIGHEATLTRALGGSVECHVDVTKSEEFQPDGFQGQVTEPLTIIEFCIGEIVTVAVRGDVVAIADGVFAGNYTVDSEYENDGYFQKVVVT